MTNIATVFKAEVVRLARKELRSQSVAFKKASNSHRADIAALKRAVRDLQQEVVQLRRRLAKLQPAPVQEEEASQVRLRFSPAGLQGARQRLELSRDACGAIVGVSGQTIYLWETGRARPAQGHLPAIAKLRKMGKREAATILAALQAA